jgi:hypothetical protein
MRNKQENISKIKTRAVYIESRGVKVDLYALYNSHNGYNLMVTIDGKDFDIDLFDCDHVERELRALGFSGEFITLVAKLM